MLDSLARGAEFAEIVRGFVDRATAPLLVRLAELEKRPTSEVVEAQVERAVRAAVEALPKPADGKDGRDGVDGKDGEKGEPGRDAEPVDAEAISQAVEHALSLAGGDRIGRAVDLWLKANPPKDGEPGRDGKDGADGRDGSDGQKGDDGSDAEPVTFADIQRAVSEVLTPQEGRLDPVAAQVQRWMEANPPKAGADGRDGRDGKDGKDGSAAPVVADAFKDHEGQLVLTLTDGMILRTGIYDGKDGERGQDGKDGLEPDDIELGWGDDGRTLTAKFIYGETAMVIEAKGEPAPFCIDRGVFKAGETYVKGDGVTWGGSYWIAKHETGEKPDTSDHWRLAVKRGQNGKDGKNGDPGKPGEPGKKGDPGRDGKSWG